MGEIQFFLKHRNKYLQGETVRSAGVRAVGQRLVQNWPEARTFLDQWSRDAQKKNNAYAYPLVVKPVESAGSDDVFKCESLWKSEWSW